MMKRYSHSKLSVCVFVLKYLVIFIHSLILSFNHQIFSIHFYAWMYADSLVNKMTDSWPSKAIQIPVHHSLEPCRICDIAPHPHT